MWGEVRLGSNTVRDTTGVIEVDGVELVGLELGNDGKALLDLEIYNARGERLAKLRKNEWVVGDKQQFTLLRTADHVSMTDKTSGRLILDALLSTKSINVAAADLYGPSGSHVRVRADGVLEAGGNYFAGNTISGFGKAIVVGSTGISIGQR